MKKVLIFGCIALFSLVFLAGCAPSKAEKLLSGVLQSEEPAVVSTVAENNASTATLPPT